MKRKRIWITVATAVTVTLIVLICLTNVFTHGFYSNAKDISTIPKKDRINTVVVTDPESSFSFVPKDNYFTGFDFYFTNVTPCEGMLNLIISTSEGKTIDQIGIDLNQISDNSWYKVKTNKELKTGKHYFAKFSTEGQSDKLPSLLQVTDKHISDEIRNGSLLIGFAYGRATFSPDARILIGILLLGLYLAIIGNLINGGKRRLFVIRASVFIVLTVLLSWNYMYNSMDNANSGPGSFQQDSEGLVVDKITASEQGKEFQNPEDSGYGLGRIRDDGTFGAYKSQFGLQGKVFEYIAKLFHYRRGMTQALHLTCAIMTASVFMAIVFLLDRKYNRLIAGCFFVTFWLSPWVVNFARNLYWVEFTWFIPMAVGLFCSIRIDSKPSRIATYFLAAISIMVKCLCGYEYISTIMMGLIAFPVVDMLLSIVHKNPQRTRLLFRTIILLGIVALAGFAAAILIHAPIKGNGSIKEGIKLIIQQDVLRRTSGGDLNNFAPVYWDSLNASIWETYCLYFHFHTQVITGITGNLFPLLCIIPLAIFVFQAIRKKLDYENVFMYGFFFLTAISWFCLAKSHSYIHTHMNYVMWYFGYVQTCLYIIVKCAYEWIKGKQLPILHRVDA